MFYSRLFTLLIISIALFTSSCFAKNINLYDQPKIDAKVIGTIDSEKGIIPIFTSADKNWLEVGDPQNGNVGWIKSSDISDATNNFTLTQQVINSGKGQHAYIMQFGMPKQFSTEAAQNLFKQVQIQQNAIEKNIQQLVNDLYKNTNLQNMNAPIIVPVIMMEKPTAQPAPATPQAK